MLFSATALPGVVVVEIDPIEDLRGFFARTWCAVEFARNGMAAEMVQASIAFNKKKGTLRGIHFQAPPRREARLIRCTAGAAFVVVLDLRPDRESFKRSINCIASAVNHRAIYVPPGCGLGYQTLEDNTELHYQMSAGYDPAGAAGVRWNDPAFAIHWPISDPILSDRDRSWPDYIKTDKTPGL